jgi:hypothetical protein
LSRKPEKADSPPASIAAKPWQAIAFGAAALAYIVYFIAADPKRGSVLGWLLLPDDLVHSWVDGDWSRFAIFDRVPIVAAASSILLVTFLAGQYVMQRVGVDRRLSQLEIVVFGTGVGLNLISLFTLAVGLMGGLQLRWVFSTAGIAVVVLSCLTASRRRLRAEPKVTTPLRSRLRLAVKREYAVYLSIPFVIVVIAGSLLPPWHFDTREYHAQVPKEWFQQGAVTFMPHNVYGNMPLGAEMHSIVGMNLAWGEYDWWWGTLIGKTIIGAYAPLTALALLAFGKRFLSITSGAIAAFVFISTPWVMHVSASGLIDGASAFYLMGTFYALMIWREQLRSDESSTPMLLLAGFLAGSAVACKYPAMLFVVIPGAVAAVCIPFGKLHIRQAIVFSLAVTVACGLWFGKNAVLAENPTYPLLYSVFGGKTRTAEKDEQWTTAHGPPHDADGRSFTWNYFRSSASLLLWQSEFASPLLVPLAVLGVLSRRHRPLIFVLAGLIAFNVVAWWLLTHRIDRFLVPILPLVALLAGIGATSFSDQMWQRTIALILGIGFVFNLLFVTLPLPGDNRFLTSYEQLRLDELSDGPFSSERVHRAQKHLNENVKPSFQVMTVGEAQVFDLEMPVIYNTCFDDCVFEQMMKGRTKKERVAALHENRISHVLVMWYELDRYRSPGNYGYSNYVTRELIQSEFVDNGIFREIKLGLKPGNSQLFEVVGSQSREQTTSGLP